MQVVAQLGLTVYAWHHKWRAIFSHFRSWVPCRNQSWVCIDITCLFILGLALELLLGHYEVSNFKDHQPGPPTRSSQGEPFRGIVRVNRENTSLPQHRV
jgi:hypothetical protein